MASSTKRTEQPNFIHHINGTKAEELLRVRGQHGSYLIRISSENPDSYSLSYREGNEIKHVKFQATNEGFVSQHVEDEYPTIGALIAILVKIYQDCLIYQIWPSAPAPRGLDPRYFFAGISRKQAECILMDEDSKEEGNFLFRYSTQVENELVISVRTDRIDHIIVGRENNTYFMKGKENIKQFCDANGLMDHYMKDRKPLVRMDETQIRLYKAKICPYANQETKEPNYIAKEFEILQSTDCEIKSTKTTKIGNLPKNKPKNRYKNILPYDHTIVKLSSDGEDYINANYLTNDISELTKYIGAQGPLADTAGDFWQMIWQEKISLIVMLTLTVEGGKNKCHQYWPKEENAVQSYETFSITNLGTEIDRSCNGYVITKLKLISKKEDSERTVYHCQYTGWPDKSVPTDVDSLVTFTEEVLKRNTSDLILAHCSAGIGRTGAYVLISMIIEYIKIQGVEPDVLKFSKKLREQRPGMVQTLQQYELVYKAMEISLNKHKQEIAGPYGNVNSTVVPEGPYSNVNSTVTPDNHYVN